MIGFQNGPQHYILQITLQLLLFSDYLKIFRCSENKKGITTYR